MSQQEGRLFQPLPYWAILLFSLSFSVAFVPLVGEYLYGSPQLIISILVCWIGLLLFLSLLVFFLSAQDTVLGQFIRSLAKVFFAFPRDWWRHGLPSLIGRQPVRTGVGLAFWMASGAILSFTLYTYWPRLTSKWHDYFSERPLTKKEQAWEDFRRVRRLLKAYRKKYRKYPPRDRWVEELQRFVASRPELQKDFAKLHIQKIHNRLQILDPWGDPYVYTPYKKWKIFPSYRFYSYHLPHMK